MENNFRHFWMKYKTRSIPDRKKYVDSLSEQARDELFSSFFEDGWYELFLRNQIDDTLDFVKLRYGIDLIDMRIKVLSSGRVFLTEAKTWDDICKTFSEFTSLFSTDFIFGGLSITKWGKKDQYYRIGPL